MVILFSLTISGLFFTDDTKEIDTKAAIGNVVIIFIFTLLISKKSSFGLFVFVDFVATYCKFVAVGFASCLLEDVKDFVVFIFCEVAVGQKTSCFLGVFLGE